MGEKANTEYLSVLVAKANLPCWQNMRQAREDREDKGLRLCTALLRLVCVQGLVQHIGKCILMRRRSSEG